MPKGTRIVAQTGNTVTVRFKAAVCMWWKITWLVIPLCALAPIVGGISGFVGEAARPPEYYQINPFGDMAVAPRDFVGAAIGGVFMWGLIAAVIAFLVLRLTRPWVELYADHEHVRVGRLRFDRKHYGGIRLGYQIQTNDGMLANDFHDLDIGLQGLRVVYGPWGEDLPWLVNKYHANEIVLWLNIMIAGTQPQAPAPVAETGQREQKFE